MEIERRNDATKQDQLNESIKRSAETISIHVYPIERPQDEVKSYDDIKSELEQIGFMTMYNNEIIYECAEFLKAVIKSPNKNLEIDITGIIGTQFLDIDKKEIYLDDIFIKLEEIINNKNINKQFDEIINEDDVFIQIECLKGEIAVIAPYFPENEIVSFKDIFTQCNPRFILYYIQKILVDFGSEAKLNLSDCSIEAKLATKNFPSPVIISIQIYFNEEYDSHLVRFDRIAGDVLHFARVLKKLVSNCGYVLTGLSNEQFDIIDEKENEQIKINDKNDNIVNNFDVDSGGSGVLDNNSNMPSAANVSSNNNDS